MPIPAAEKRKRELDNLKNERIKHIIECSFGLFAENGIENISMNELAFQAEIGVASLYRYFSTKEELALEVACYAWDIEKSIFKDIYSSESYNLKNGFEQLKNLMEVFETAIVGQRLFFSFVYYFDSFIKLHKISPERLKKYEESVYSANELVMSALEKGQSDGSIKFSESKNGIIAKSTTKEICYTITHSLFCLAQKLSISGEILSMDKDMDPRRQVKLLINIILESLAA